LRPTTQRARGASIIFASDGNLYGTTPGDLGSATPTGLSGTVFKLSTDGTYITLHTFAGSDGVIPNGLLFGSDGNIYGTTAFGGTSGNQTNSTGTVFKLTPAGSFTSLYSFSIRDNDGHGTNSDGANPAELSQSADGTLYGLAESGGSGNNGTVFELTATDHFLLLASIASCSTGVCRGGGNSMAPAGAGVFYGASTIGGVGTTTGSVWKFAVNSGGGGGGSTGSWLVVSLGLAAAMRQRRSILATK
jgi:MYXO-CTERM domain-containing protein